MPVLRIVWATHYLRWVAILSATAGAHAVAFCIYVSTSGWGSGTHVPEGRVTLYLAQAEPPSEVPLTPVRTIERPTETRATPVEVSPPRTSHGRVLPAPPLGTACAPQPISASSPLPQARRPETCVAADTEPLRRTIGAESHELDRPISLGEHPAPSRLAQTGGRSGATAGAVPGYCANAVKPQGHGSAQRLISPTTPGGGGVEPDFALSGKPVYPVECRRGDCSGHAPCEGVSRWRITVSTPDAKPVRVERVQSAGCERLDASTKAFLREARIPRAGVFLLRFRFKLDGSR